MEHVLVTLPRSQQCHTAVVAVRWKVLAVPELVWTRTGSRSCGVFSLHLDLLT